MQRILTNAQMREADLYTIEKLGVSEEDLVWRAGRAIADEINRRFMGGRVLVCIGKGNNGADGTVVAQLLSKTHGFTVKTVNVQNGIFKVFENDFDIIVDCIFGTGLNREVEGKYKTAIELINSSKAFVISCDIPSGLNGDSGMPMGACVKANLTIAIQEFKLGHFINHGKDFCGEVIVKDIGISIWGDDYITRITPSTAKKFFLKRPSNVNKGNFGKVSVFGGSKSFPGSVLLSLNGLTALKMGTGYSNLAVPNSLTNIYSCINPELTITSIDDIDGNILLDPKSLDKLMSYNSIAFGMGIGVTQEVYKTLSFILQNYKGKLLIDADGINCLSKFGVDILKNKSCSVVLTPHIGEFARLIDTDKQLILRDCVSFAKEFAKKYNVVLILKSNSTIITDGERIVLNTTGCSGLAKGGSGDVLSGICAGLLARTNEVFEACCVAPYLFGLAGEYAQKEQNEYTITATDVINALPRVINSFDD